MQVVKEARGAGNRVKVKELEKEVKEMRDGKEESTKARLLAMTMGDGGRKELKVGVEEGTKARLLALTMGGSGESVRGPGGPARGPGGSLGARGQGWGANPLHTDLALKRRRLALARLRMANM